MIGNEYNLWDRTSTWQSLKPAKIIFDTDPYIVDYVGELGQGQREPREIERQRRGLSEASVLIIVILIILNFCYKLHIWGDWINMTGIITAYGLYGLHVLDSNPPPPGPVLIGLTFEELRWATARCSDLPTCAPSRFRGSCSALYRAIR